MRRLHTTQLARPFVVRYWTAVGLVLALPLLLIAATVAGSGGSPLNAIALPWIVAVGAAALVMWRWRAHRIEITDDAVIERHHPLLLYQRRRDLAEITEVGPCPPERRGVAETDASLLLRCRRPNRDLAVTPANPDQLLDDLAAVDPRLRRFRGRVVRVDR